jgi:ribonuclease P protein component
MFAKKEQIKKLGRLRKRSDFLSVQATGRKWVSKTLILQIRDHEMIEAHDDACDLTADPQSFEIFNVNQNVIAADAALREAGAGGYSRSLGGDEASINQRFGLTVTKKVSKKAVIRNRIRRRLRAVARDILPEFGALHRDYVLIGRIEALTVSYQKLQNDLRWCLRKLEAHEAALLGDTPASVGAGNAQAEGFVRGSGAFDANKARQKNQADNKEKRAEKAEIADNKGLVCDESPKERPE